MDEDREFIAAVERHEDAIRQLEAALSRCHAADVTTNEILGVVRRLLFGDDGVLIEGSFVERITHDEAATVLRILYAALCDDTTLTFIARGAPARIHALCDDAGISRNDVTITAEADRLRVSITKLQS